MQLVVLVTSLKYFFVEGGEFIVGLHTSRRIGLTTTIKITLVGISFALILFLIFFYSSTLIPTRLLELMIGIALY